MIFFSHQFAVFTGLFFIAYWAVPIPLARRLLLLLASVTFQVHFSGPAGVLPIIVLAVGTYFVALSRNRLLCALWITVCALALIFYKYTHFLFQGIIGVAFPDLAKSGEEALAGILPTLPPLGVSFFVFEFVHYLMEIRRGHRPIRSPLTFALFTSFWPSLVAGPIKRYRQFSVSLSHGARNVSSDDVIAGMVRLAIGICKKFLGDVLTSWIQSQQASFDVLPLSVRWGIVVAIAFRILLDFSGYSDMAIGFARMMGIRLPENFNWPYIAHSITDFWRRWHISLSTWIRDYIYIPLGGSRHGLMRKSLNGFIAMALCGLWHGAAWNFALWGVYHGVGLAIAGALPLPRLLSEKPPLVFSSFRPAALAATWLAWRGFSWAATMLFVMIGWLLFFYPVDQAFHMTLRLFSH
ncbi:MAG: MBOAT family protein [Rhodopseudomonas palustris]|uniref:Probable alginate O-acetylase AlgI n=1 Tax=Rhodopseudomonas palustris TaxID=1076 RepID=A0A933S1L2_RHOPL|nr:MBOAT family protein [Rhodopseudomonas palustris]